MVCEGHDSPLHVASMYYKRVGGDDNCGSGGIGRKSSLGRYKACTCASLDVRGDLGQEIRGIEDVDEDPCMG